MIFPTSIVQWLSVWLVNQLVSSKCAINILHLVLVGRCTTVSLFFDSTAINFERVKPIVFRTVETQGIENWSAIFFFFFLRTVVVRSRSVLFVLKNNGTSLRR